RLGERNRSIAACQTQIHMSDKSNQPRIVPSLTGRGIDVCSKTGDQICEPVEVNVRSSATNVANPNITISDCFFDIDRTRTLPFGRQRNRTSPSLPRSEMIVSVNQPP